MNAKDIYCVMVWINAECIIIGNTVSVSFEWFSVDKSGLNSLIFDFIFIIAIRLYSVFTPSWISGVGQANWSCWHIKLPFNRFTLTKSQFCCVKSHTSYCRIINAFSPFFSSIFCYFKMYSISTGWLAGCLMHHRFPICILIHFRFLHFHLKRFLLINSFIIYHVE